MAWIIKPINIARPLAPIRSQYLDRDRSTGLLRIFKAIMRPLTTHFMTKSTHSRSSRVRFANALDAMLRMWFWFKYRNRSDGKPLKAPGCSIVIWLSFKKIECSWVRPLKASVGTSLIWLNRKSLKKNGRLQNFFIRIFLFVIEDFPRLSPLKRIDVELDLQVDVLSEMFFGSFKAFVHPGYVLHVVQGTF